MAVQKLPYYKKAEEAPVSLENDLKMASFVVDKLRKVGSRGAHCVSQTINQDKMRVKILPALSDNYMYLVSLIKAS